MALAIQERNCRIDIRLTQQQRSNYEQAAALRGQTLSQWSTGHLDECARRDIDEANTTSLGREAFESFCQMLEAPLPEATASLLARKEMWA